LEAAGCRATADGLAEADVRVAFYGALFRPRGAMTGGGPPYTAADVKTGPERDLLESWYEAALEQDPALGPRQGAMGPGKVAVEAIAVAASAVADLRRGRPARVHREPEAGDRVPDRS